MSGLKTFFSLMRMCLAARKRLLAVTLLAVFCVNLLEIAFPKLVQIYIDAIGGLTPSVAGRPLQFLTTAHGQIVLLPIGLLVFAGIRWITTYARAVLQTQLGQGALFDLRSRIFNTMQNLSFAYHDASHTGTLISNVVEDVNYSARFFQFGLYPLLESTTFSLLAYIMMFMICPPAAMGSLILLLLALLGTYIYFRFGYRFFARTKELFAESVQIFTENMEGHPVVRAFGVHKTQEEAYGRAVGRLHSAIITETLISSIMSQSLFWAVMLGMPLMLAAAINSGRAGHWNMTGGNLTLLFMLQSSLMFRMRMLTRGLSLAMWFAITAERLGNLFGAQDFLADDGTRSLPSHGPGSFRIEDLSFSYPGSSASLHNISLDIRAGETVGIVGRTGSGKSTLALLLCRFYDPDSGQIALDGQDMREYALRDLRDQFSLVFQETFLFSASIRDNIAYGHPNAAFEDIVSAATIAEAHDFIMDFPEGYDTLVGERGVTLSGGQRQRLSIARAILRRPRVLLLDACTSAVDPLTEAAIQKSLSALRETSTIVIIAQRYSSVAGADKVYVVDRGRVVESGSPDALNKPGTMFSRILKTQHTTPGSPS